MASSKTITNKRIIEALKEAKGNMTLAAKMLGCTRQMIYKRSKTSKKIQDTIAESREVAVDNAESALQRAVLEGNFKAIAFTLRTIGRDRGYVERTEQEISGPRQTPVKIQLVDLGDDLDKQYADGETD